MRFFYVQRPHRLRSSQTHLVTSTKPQTSTFNHPVSFPFLDNADYSEENSPRVTEGPIRCHICAQLERQEGVALKGSSLLHKEVPTATQGKDLERFPGMPTLLSGERQEAGQAEESLKGNLILPRPPHKHFFPGVAHIWGLIWLKNFDKGC